MTACLWQANPDYSNMDVVQALMQSASQYDEPDIYLGYGIPNYEEANNILGTLEIDFSDSDLQFTVSLNPFVHNLIIEEENHLIHIDVIDLPGNRLFSKEYNHTSSANKIQVYLADVKRGLYILRIQVDGIQSSRKIIKY